MEKCELKITRVETEYNISSVFNPYKFHATGIKVSYGCSGCGIAKTERFLFNKSEKTMEDLYEAAMLSIEVPGSLPKEYRAKIIMTQCPNYRQHLGDMCPRG